MTPPQLTRDAPRLNIVEPVEVHFFAGFGHDLGTAFPHGVQCGLHDLGGVDEPLVGQGRLYHHLGPVAKRLHDFLGFNKWYGLGDFDFFAVVVLFLARDVVHHGEAFGGDRVDDQLAGVESI